ncbi:MAG: hypothetical protein ACC669_08275, partial [bacterium]
MGGSVAPLATFRDGSPDDDDPATGVFRANVENFFLSTLVRAETDLVLAFEPRIDVCRGGSVQLGY